MNAIELMEYRRAKIPVFNANKMKLGVFGRKSLALDETGWLAIVGATLCGCPGAGQTHRPAPTPATPHLTAPYPKTDIRSARSDETVLPSVFVQRSHTRLLACLTPAQPLACQRQTHRCSSDR